MRTRLVLPLLFVLAGFVAGCASLDDAGARLPWRDQWGDRGGGVLARDHAMCRDLVETRRSLLASCMQQRGWLLNPTP